MLERGIVELRKMEESARGKGILNRCPCPCKVLVTVAVIAAGASVPRHRIDISSLLLLYPAILFLVSKASVKECIRRIRLVIPFLFFVGIANPFLDREAFFVLGGLEISGGMVSMVTLFEKGCLAVLSVYFLMITTTIEEICRFLRMLHVPKILVIVILLIYRYIYVLMEEAQTMYDAYMLRAPGQKGIHFRVWGTFAGQLLLRSMDRAVDVYESMCVRGFDGEFPV